ncbi:MAG: hypothetical protein KBH07_09410 [Flavobacteriales bacterium]|nr:hypothetical protein [Flavobacteriales bacterium]MBP9080892.1 hypothetical protein [Flavobacteriales bacterium]
MTTPEENPDEAERLAYEARVRRRVPILLKYLKEGKLSVADKLAPQVRESLAKLRYDAQGELVLDSVDEFIRSMAIYPDYLESREETKSIASLAEIQRKYFSVIESNFGFIYDKMVEANWTPQRTAEHFADAREETVDHLNESIDELLAYFTEFWQATSEVAYTHLEDAHSSIKAVFGGDMFPRDDENIVSKCGLYADTVVLPDPFVRTRMHFTKWSKRERVFYMVKHSMNVLQYKVLAVAEVDKPIVVILPDKELMPEGELEEIARLGAEDCVFHCSKLFGMPFKSLEEVDAYGRTLDSIDKAIASVRSPERLLINAEDQSDLKQQLAELCEGPAKLFAGITNPGQALVNNSFGRLAVANELILKAAQLSGTPLIEAPTSWEYFKWKLEYDAERANPGLDVSRLHMTRALNELGGRKLEWFGRVPVKALIELRQTGAIDEVRALLSSGVDEIAQSAPGDFEATSQKVMDNINAAFDAHLDNVEKLKQKKWKFAGHDVGSWLVSGAIEVTAACVGTPIWGLSTFALNQFLDAPKLKDIPKDAKEIADLSKKVKRSPIGVLFKYKTYE